MLKKIANFLRSWQIFLGVWFIALSATFLAVNLTFHRGIALDEARAGEEGAKLLASYVLSLVSLGISEALENHRRERRAVEQRELALLEIASHRDKLKYIYGFDLSWFNFPAIPLERNRTADAQRQQLSQKVKQSEEAFSDLKQRFLAGEPNIAIRNFDLIQRIDAFLQSSTDYATEKTEVTVRQLQEKALALMQAPERSG